MPVPTIDAVVHVTPAVSSDGCEHEYSETDAAAMRALNLDVLVRVGSWTPSKEILSAAPLGVITLDCDGTRLHRGGPTGFWETYTREPQTRFAICRRTHDKPCGTVLKSGSFVTHRYYTRNQDRVVSRSAPHVWDVLRELSANRATQVDDPSGPEDGHCRQVPSVGVQCRYAARVARQLFGAMFGLVVAGRREEWSVAVAAVPWDAVDMAQAVTLDSPRGHFLADPFVVERDGRTVCFVEDFDHVSERGSIAAYDLSSGIPERLGTALAEPFHVSYPFIFEYDGRLFMCPESQEMRDVRVYECTSFPLEWQLTTVLLRDISAVDPTLLQWGDRWWLLVTTDPSNIGADSDCLEVFSADDPLSSTWTAHAANPVRLDADDVRCGGAFTDRGRVLRVAQRPGFSDYGHAFTVREIRGLSESEFDEVEVAEFDPGFRRGIDGTHHLHTNGEWTAFDYRRHRRILFPNVRLRRHPQT